MKTWGIFLAFVATFVSTIARPNVHPVGSPATISVGPGSLNPNAVYFIRPQNVSPSILALQQPQLISSEQAADLAAAASEVSYISGSDLPVRPTVQSTVEEPSLAASPSGNVVRYTLVNSSPRPRYGPPSGQFEQGTPLGESDDESDAQDVSQEDADEGDDDEDDGEDEPGNIQTNDYDGDDDDESQAEVPTYSRGSPSKRVKNNGRSRTSPQTSYGRPAGNGLSEYESEPADNYAGNDEVELEPVQQREQVRRRQKPKKVTESGRYKQQRNRNRNRGYSKEPSGDRIRNNRYKSSNKDSVRSNISRRFKQYGRPKSTQKTSTVRNDGLQGQGGYNIQLATVSSISPVGINDGGGYSGSVSSSSSGSSGGPSSSGGYSGLAQGFQGNGNTGNLPVQGGEQDVRVVPSLRYEVGQGNVVVPSRDDVPTARLRAIIPVESSRQEGTQQGELQGNSQQNVIQQLQNVRINQQSISNQYGASAGQAFNNAQNSAENVSPNVQYGIQNNQRQNVNVGNSGLQNVGSQQINQPSSQYGVSSPSRVDGNRIQSSIDVSSQYYSALPGGQQNRGGAVVQNQVQNPSFQSSNNLVGRPGARLTDQSLNEALNLVSQFAQSQVTGRDTIANPNGATTMFSVSPSQVFIPNQQAAEVILTNPSSPQSIQNIQALTLSNNGIAQGSLEQGYGIPQISGGGNQPQQFVVQQGNVGQQGYIAQQGNVGQPGGQRLNAGQSVAYGAPQQSRSGNFVQVSPQLGGQGGNVGQVLSQSVGQRLNAGQSVAYGAPQQSRTSNLIQVASQSGGNFGQILSQSIGQQNSGGQVGAYGAPQQLNSGNLAQVSSQGVGPQSNLAEVLSQSVRQQIVPHSAYGAPQQSINVGQSISQSSGQSRNTVPQLGQQSNVGQGSSQHGVPQPAISSSSSETGPSRLTGVSVAFASGNNQLPLGTITNTATQPFFRSIQNLVSQQYGV